MIRLITSLSRILDLYERNIGKFLKKGNDIALSNNLNYDPKG